MRWRRIFLGLVTAVAVCLITGIFLHLTYKPVTQSRTEIFKGVFLTVEELPKSSQGSGKVMIVEVHWDTPGIRIANRPFDYQFGPDNPITPHYDLEFADLALRRNHAAVLMNTCIFQPDAILKSLPGRSVRAVDTIVTEGRVSHIHEHSYLLYWDRLMNAHMVPNKPPDAESLENAYMGLGMQGIQISGGSAGYGALDSQDDVYSRTFIGVDPLKRILFLIAFENASGFVAINKAVEAGVIFGGQLDSGSSTNLLIGKNARDIKPHTGIRNLRPLGPYITIHAEPL